MVLLKNVSLLAIDFRSLNRAVNLATRLNADLFGFYAAGVGGPDPLPGQSQVGISFLRDTGTTPSSQWIQLLLKGSPYGPLYV